MTADIPGVILAGGLARRMGGGDKSLLPLAGRPILAHVIDRLKPQTAGLAINANGDPARFAAYGLPVLADPMGDYPGPLAGVLAGLLFARERGHTAIVTVAADTPFFPADLVARLRAAAEGSGLALAATPSEARGVDRHPTFGLWPVALIDDLDASLRAGVRKIVAWTDRHGAGTAVFEPAGYDPFFNVNTPQDRDEAEAILAAMP